MPRGLSVVKPRSACPACGAAIGAADLVPLLSYAMLRGKCRACGAPIPFRYPLIEFMCGALWAALFWRLSLSFEYVCYVALCSILLAVFFIDLEWMRIPNKLVLCAMLPAVAVSVRYAFALSPPDRFRSVYGSINAAAPLLGLAPCAVFLCISVASAFFRGGKCAVGMGDVKLLIPAGLALGLRQGLFAMFISIMLGGLAGVLLIISGKKNRKDPIPFGPFIVAGVTAAIFIPMPLF
ncbi:MAG: prepilin peptidase [Oscillospiraceae bacterium]|nr:prepilin peptidase [Oscillospiraceae bacterium]